MSDDKKMFPDNSGEIYSTEVIAISIVPIVQSYFAADIKIDSDDKALIRIQLANGQKFTCIISHDQ